MSRPGQTCTVKLPDPKDSAKDIWIDSPLAGSTPQDAQHRAALYALYQLGPTVPHDRVLPDPYKEVWSGWRATPPPPPRRDRDGGGGGGRGGGGGGRGDGGGRGGGGRGRGGGPSAPQASDVSMDEQTRESVQRALAAVRTDGGGAAAAASTAASDSRTDAAVARVVRELEQLGFGAAAANEAARAVHARDPAVGGAQLRERAVDWLCLQLPESELPHALQTRHRVQIVRPQIVRPPSAPAAKAPAAEPPAAEDALLGRRGFSAADVAAALKEADGDKVAALLRLLRAVGRVGQQAWGDDDDAAAVAEMREEEETALEAIYADGFTSSDEPGARVLRIKLASITPPGTLELWLPAEGGYPLAPALPSFVCASLAPAALAALHGRLARDAAQLAAERSPAAFALASWLEAELSSFVAETHPPPPLLLGSAAAPAVAEEAMAEEEVEEVGTEAPPAQVHAAAKRGGGGRSVGRGGGRGRGGGAADGVRAIAGSAAVDERLRAEQEQRDSAPEGAARRAARAKLPAAASRDAILAELAAKRVLVICGETGCGKSTQVPQFLLEGAARAGGGSRCSVVVTQPRRIAAIALAERVAAERGERVGGSVGYQVKGDAKRGASTRLLYCTTGVLLRRLQSDAHMRGVSHVVIDEVHERGIDSDFLLIILKAALASNPTLRVVLMSATVDAERFAELLWRAEGDVDADDPGAHLPD